MDRPLAGGRVLVVGLDMGDGDLIRHWSERGHLPHLGELARSGAWVDLDSTAEVLHTSTWPTFATGTLPGKHGVYYPYQPKPGEQMAAFISPDQYGTQTFWKAADAAHRRVVVYDIPETFPEAGFGGRAIFEWGTWAWYGTPVSQPPELMGQLKSRFGGYPLGYEAKRLGLGIPKDLEQRLIGSVRHKSQTARWLLDGGDWDLAVIGLCEPHSGGHYLWPAGVERVGVGPDSAFGPLRNLYQEIDRAIGDLRASLPSDATMMVLSGDGVRPSRSGWHLLPKILERLRFTVAPGADGGAAPARPRSAMGLAQALVPAGVKSLIAANLPWRLRDQLGMRAQAANIDWAKTRAFALPTDLEGCIRVNLKGREPQGIVDPGTQYDDVCRELRVALEELVNPATGARAVRRVWIRNEVFPGPMQEHLPDVIVTWNDDAPIEAVTSSGVGTIDGVNPDPRPGTHSRAGFLIASGPGVGPSSRGSGRLTDVAPTVMNLLGLDLPGADGQPLDLLRPGTTKLAGAVSGAS
jgi:predicted AlkP superfamily phosphohydrolase/phosphomutase